MPEKKTQERGPKARQEGKAPSTQAGEFMNQEIEHVRKGKPGVQSTKQAIAIGLSKARSAGENLHPPIEKGQEAGKPEARRLSGQVKALQEESQTPVSRKRHSARSRAAMSRRTRAQRLGVAAKRKARFRARR